MGYAYVMTHPGVPSVFWEHFFEDSADLKVRAGTCKSPFKPLMNT